MNKYTLTKTFTFYDADILDVICSAVYDIGYWSCIDNDTEVWNNTSDSLDKDSTFEDVFFEVLKSGNAVHLIDVEDDEEIWELTFDKLLHGMQLAIDSGDWDGDVDSLDGSVGDMIFQYALFDEVVYG
jgi:hypothetical protein